MATNDKVTVDTTNLQKLGSNLKTSAANIGGKTNDVKDWKFGAAQAGRAYGSEGDKVGAGLSRVGTWLKNWQTAIDKTGSNITTSASSYASVDDANVKKITAAGVNLG
ncbi:type VII secretion target [Nocardia sp. NPDC051832]|uniref:type VII secretion target n=1 Tax=Nocardia sp. NPDC051832 TaxID=3155673 RepID=UPI00341C038B